MESTVGTATPLLFATKIIPSELVILYPDITLIYYELYIGCKKERDLIMELR